jgi:drug/metabolite transporter (DMT)-like permease
MTTRAATAVGFISILLWSQLAVLTTLSGTVPPFQLVAMSFALGGAIGFIYLLRIPKGLQSLVKTPTPAWALGVAGLFGYHFFYFLALRSAPAVEANLINYLWPLLIVLLSALFPASGDERGLKWWHVCGAALGLAGTILIVAGGKGSAFSFDNHEFPWLGYGAALVAAFIWPCYSIANRRYASVPSTSVAGFCLVTAVVALMAHLALETTVWPENITEWLAMAGLGLGPAGTAFYFWDYGVKHGDLSVLGAVAYATPLLSTLSLVAFGLSTATPALWIACLLITLGAVLAAKDMLLGSKT